jgi:hypothetical protein
MLIVMRLLWFVGLAAGFFGFAMVYYALTATFRGEYRYSEEAANRSLASIVFNLIAGFALLSAASWLFTWLRD